MSTLFERFLVPRPMSPRADIGIIIPQTKRHKMALQPRLDPSCHQTVIDVQLETVSIEEQEQLIDVQKTEKVSFPQELNKNQDMEHSEELTDLSKVSTENSKVSTGLLKVSTENPNPPRAESSGSQKACRFCFEPNGDLISPCKCSGSQSFVHIACMREWIEKSTQVRIGECWVLSTVRVNTGVNTGVITQKMFFPTGELWHMSVIDPRVQIKETCLVLFSRSVDCDPTLVINTPLLRIQAVPS